MVGQRPKLKIHKLDPTQNFQKIDPPAPYWQCNVNFVQYRGNIGTFFPNYKLSPTSERSKGFHRKNYGIVYLLCQSSFLFKRGN